LTDRDQERSIKDALRRPVLREDLQGFAEACVAALSKQRLSLRQLGKGLRWRPFGCAGRSHDQDGEVKSQAHLVLRHRISAEVQRNQLGYVG
jgi:hypothetical protein